MPRPAGISLTNRETPESPQPRVYYNNMGHSESTWQDARFRTSLVNGGKWVTKKRLDPTCFTGTQPLPRPQQPPMLSRDAQIIGDPCRMPKGAQYYLLDLSTWEARSADVALELTVPNPLDDYDLSVTTAWGWYGLQQPQGATTERVVIRNAPHCALLQVYGDNRYGISGQPPDSPLACCATPHRPGSKR